MSNAIEYATAGAEALRRGDPLKARELLQRAADNGRADATVMLGLARACKALADERGMTAALDRLLASEPRNVPALILRADSFAAAGDTRSASSFYLAAIRAAPPAAQTAPDLAQELRRAQQMCERYANEYKTYLRQSLSAKGFDEGRSSPRFAQSLDIILGRKQIYLQQPRYYYFPGLPQIQFYERAQFPWMDELEAATGAIQAELAGVMQDADAFAPYVTGDANRPRNDKMGMLNNPAWSAFYLVKNGDLVPKNAARCPKTMRALEHAPLARVPYRSPSVLFSLLKPGAHIPPHNGLVNTRLVCHLPVVVPGKCTFRVGNDLRDWVYGKAWAFDDTIEHEAWNHADQTRVVLLFDIWRPELTEEERALVVSLFEAIDAHSGKKPEWEI
ncbi:MAG TPA: aspartyl/asparaginyl beta-hydroxylase domain-containing protein [Steroidobacteraceae bacterium]|nr:aspartyl/asparaginyl beta-hydroxylase domain-containing protein [Steroidobacteraceae bacterium]